MMTLMPIDYPLRDRIVKSLEQSNLADNSDIPRSEYEHLAEIIFNRLLRDEVVTQDRVKRVVQEEVEGHFGVKSVLTDTRLVALARHIYYVLRAYQAIHSTQESRASQILTLYLLQ